MAAKWVIILSVSLGSVVVASLIITTIFVLYKRRRSIHSTQYQPLLQQDDESCSTYYVELQNTPTLTPRINTPSSLTEGLLQHEDESTLVKGYLSVYSKDEKDKDEMVDRYISIKQAQMQTLISERETLFAAIKNERKALEKLGIKDKKLARRKMKLLKLKEAWIDKERMRLQKLKMDHEEDIRKYRERKRKEAEEIERERDRVQQIQLEEEKKRKELEARLLLEEQEKRKVQQFLQAEEQDAEQAFGVANSVDPDISQDSGASLESILMDFQDEGYVKLEDPEPTAKEDLHLTISTTNVDSRRSSHRRRHAAFYGSSSVDLSGGPDTFAEDHNPENAKPSNGELSGEPSTTETHKYSSLVVDTPEEDLGRRRRSAVRGIRPNLPPTLTSDATADSTPVTVSLPSHDSVLISVSSTAVPTISAMIPLFGDDTTNSGQTQDTQIIIPTPDVHTASDNSNGTNTTDEFIVDPNVAKARRNRGRQASVMPPAFLVQPPSESKQASNAKNEQEETHAQPKEQPTTNTIIQESRTAVDNSAEMVNAKIVDSNTTSTTAEDRIVPTSKSTDHAKPEISLSIPSLTISAENTNENLTIPVNTGAVNGRRRGRQASIRPQGLPTTTTTTTTTTNTQSETDASLSSQSDSYTLMKDDSEIITVVEKSQPKVEAVTVTEVPVINVVQDVKHDATPVVPEKVDEIKVVEEQELMAKRRRNRSTVISTPSPVMTTSVATAIAGQQESQAITSQQESPTTITTTTTSNNVDQSQSQSHDVHALKTPEQNTSSEVVTKTDEAVNSHTNGRRGRSKLVAPTLPTLSVPVVGSVSDSVNLHTEPHSSVQAKTDAVVLPDTVTGLNSTQVTEQVKIEKSIGQNETKPAITVPPVLPSLNADAKTTKSSPSIPSVPVPITMETAKNEPVQKHLDTPEIDNPGTWSEESSDSSKTRETRRPRFKHGTVLKPPVFPNATTTDVSSVNRADVEKDNISETPDFNRRARGRVNVHRRSIAQTSVNDALKSEFGPSQDKIGNDSLDADLDNLTKELGLSSEITSGKEVDDLVSNLMSDTLQIENSQRQRDAEMNSLSRSSSMRKVVPQRRALSRRETAKQPTDITDTDKLLQELGAEMDVAGTSHIKLDDILGNEGDDIMTKLTQKQPSAEDQFVAESDIDSILNNMQDLDASGDHQDILNSIL